MTRQRRRTRTGAELKRLETFYCGYGKHYVIPLKFENDPNNKGICLGCAFDLNVVLSRHTYLTELNAFDKGMTWQDWHRTVDRLDEIEVFKQGATEPGWVYYVRQADLIKIGYAKDVRKRIKAYGPTAVLLAVHPGTQALERDIHRQFHESLDSGREWFRPDADLLDHIASVVGQFGEPTAFEYRYTKPRSQEEKVRAMFATREFQTVARGAHYAGR